ncbi:hypothetical protein POSPLADRAFT_1039930 [Postia placenta MAD-698-R-SB12]|uniref:Uncharacterized protein n=1 Tax=Postia placenta MAD-698-R-SB12 TaxID=670580 RepID=A0A1X6N0G1_9APHY|nr:hypothetical protein POSPLADRAFT_1039930 [Postia placenta MAD-698-R-SB12]OSX62084.1 hypothetical protein POSPLADRAFT_1039930 [Postia placenta MAD-698-R-SB12]
MEDEKVAFLFGECAPETEISGLHWRMMERMRVRGLYVAEGRIGEQGFATEGATIGALG